MRIVFIEVITDTGQLRALHCSAHYFIYLFYILIRTIFFFITTCKIESNILCPLRHIYVGIFESSAKVFLHYQTFRIYVTVVHILKKLIFSGWHADLISFRRFLTKFRD